MGLIRKTLAIGTIGTVKGSSKKQRVARETRDAVRALANPPARGVEQKIAGIAKSRVEIAAQVNAFAKMYNQALATYNVDPTPATHAVMAAMHQRYAEAHAVASSTRGVNLNGSAVPLLLPWPPTGAHLAIATMNDAQRAYATAIEAYRARPTVALHSAMAVAYERAVDAQEAAANTEGVRVGTGQLPPAPLLPIDDAVNADRCRAALANPDLPPADFASWATALRAIESGVQK